jgi:Patatin-like phospholipase
MKRLLKITSLSLFALINACSMRTTPVPIAYLDTVEPSGYKNVRYWGFEQSDVYQRKLVSSIKRGELKSTINILAISGGGTYGAFSAGLLNGWSDSGKRPKFNIVTGVSTGAIISPFAFLGNRYDKLLASLYTTMQTEQVFSLSFPIWKLISRQDSLGSSTPLQKQLQKYITRSLLDEIVKASTGERRLLVGNSQATGA